MSLLFVTLYRTGRLSIGLKVMIGFAKGKESCLLGMSHIKGS